VSRRTRLAAGLAGLAAIAVPVGLSESRPMCDPRSTICDPDNPANPDHVASQPIGLADGRGYGPLDDVRAATRRFRDVDSAIAAGYVQFFGCVHEPLAGSMGIHFVDGTLAGDTVIDAAKPEALMYEVAPDGRLTLVGVEYVVFQEAWDAENDEPPSLFGQPFVLVPSTNRYGIPAFYELHAWAWKTNPTGNFHDWNPRVLCPATEGHQH
jgi:hypothetical protein